MPIPEDLTRAPHEQAERTSERSRVAASQYPFDEELDRRAHELERGVDGLLPRACRICMVSVHTCPLAALGGKETGGMNVYVRELARELGRRGYLIDILTRSESSEVPHIANTDLGPNVRVAHLECGPEIPLGKHEVWLNAPDFVDNARRYMAEYGIHYDLYHSHYWISGWVARQLAEVEPAPIVHMFHTLAAMKELARGEGSAPETNDRRMVETEIVGFADAVVAATSAGREHMIELYGADERKIHIIPPGVDTGLFRPVPLREAQERIGQPPDHRMILFVGRMDPVKGLDTLIRAMAIVVERDPQWEENACLCIIGGDKTDDPALMDAEMKRVDRLRHELGLAGTVTFLGPRAQDDLPYYYSAAQVVVVPSRYESFGLVALEAMACGTPVIASNVGGLASLVRDGRTGFLVPDGDPVALADKLMPLLADPALRSALGCHGIATAEGYGWPAIAERIDAMYEHVIAEWRASRAT